MQWFSQFMKEDAKPLFNNKSQGEHAKGEQGIDNTISGEHSLPLMGWFAIDKWSWESW